MLGNYPALKLPSKPLTLAPRSPPAFGDPAWPLFFITLCTMGRATIKSAECFYAMTPFNGLTMFDLLDVIELASRLAPITLHPCLKRLMLLVLKPTGLHLSPFLFVSPIGCDWSNELHFTQGRDTAITVRWVPNRRPFPNGNETGERPNTPTVKPSKLHFYLLSPRLAFHT